MITIIVIYINIIGLEGKQCSLFGSLNFCIVDSRFEMTPCFQHYFMGSSTHFAHCFTAPTQFQFATIVGQVDTVNNYNSQKKLKCR